ncbi:MAG: HD domain-containing protein [Negativicutes bacterium]|nr:HD domain-containing protein [Negativicutes bacterium]
MNRIWDIQTKLLDVISQQEIHAGEREYPLHWERLHVASCAQIGQWLAVKRGVNQELAALACSLHDFGRIVTGKQANHAENGYAPVKDFLLQQDGFLPEECEQLALAVKHHSDKDKVGTPLEEIVKDADVLDCFQYGQELTRPEQRERLKKVRAELGL